MKLMKKSEMILETVRENKLAKYVLTGVLCVFAIHTIGFLLKFVLYTGVGIACLYALYKLWFDKGKTDESSHDKTEKIMRDV